MWLLMLISSSQAAWLWRGLGWGAGYVILSSQPKRNVPVLLLQLKEEHKECFLLHKHVGPAKVCGPVKWLCSVMKVPPHFSRMVCSF